MIAAPATTSAPGSTPALVLGEAEIAPAPAAPASDVGQSGQLRRDLAGALAQLGQSIQQALAADVVEVATYAVAAEGVSYDTAQARFAGAGNPQALTRISRAGGVETCVASGAGAIDENLARLHGALVQQAQAQRAELLKALLASASDLIATLKTLE